MRDWALDYLACPVTRGPLRLVDSRIENNEIVAGGLVSPEGRRYEIRDGVPRFVVLPGMETQGTESVASFGFEWNTLNLDLFHANWLAHIAKRNFGGIEYLKGKTILDCGAGSGMHSRWMIEAGAARVISLELSGTVDGIMRKNLAGFSDRNLVVQCDIANPPIRREAFELVYCINVVQHTQDPAKTTGNLYRLLGPGQELYINYYRMPEQWWNQLRVTAAEAFRRKFTARLPKALLLNLIRLACLTTYVPLLDRLALQVLICGEVPPGANFRQRRYRQAVLNTYDWFGSHAYQHHYRCYELLGLFEQAGIAYHQIPNIEEVIRLAQPGLAFRCLGEGTASPTQERR